MKTPRPIRVDGDLAYIELTAGRTSIIDSADLALVTGRCWRSHESPSSHPYAMGCFDRRNVYLHVYLMKPWPGEVVDHINGDTLDNRRANLRCCTRSQNMVNNARKPGMWARGVGFRGVSFQPYISVNGKKVYLGSYKTLEEAVAVRLAAEAEHYGEFSPRSRPLPLRDVPPPKQWGPSRYQKVSERTARGSPAPKA